MKFVEGNEENNQPNNQPDNTALFKNDNNIDLMKAQNGFEEVKNDNLFQEIVEPKAPVITDPNQLNIVPNEQASNNQTSEAGTVDEVQLNMEVQKNIENIQEPAFAPITPTIVENKPEEFMPKKKSKTGLVLLIVLLLLVGLVCGYYFLFLTPERVVKSGLSSLYGSIDTLEKKISSNMDFSTMKSAGSIKFDTTIKDYAPLKGYNIKYNVGFDLTNEKINSNLSLLNGSNDELLSIILFVKDKVSYIDADGITPKILKVDLADYTKDLFAVNESKDKMDYSYLAKVVGDALISNMSKDKLSRKITYDKAYYNSVLLKLTYNVNSEEYKKVFSAVVNAIKADSTALEILATENGGNKEETISMLDKYLEQTDYNIPDTKLEVYINLFTNKIVGASITNKYNSMTYTYSGNEYKLSIASNSKENELMESGQTIEILYNKLNNTIKLNYSSRLSELVSTIEATISMRVTNEKKSETTIDVKITPDNTATNEYMSVTMSDTTETGVTIEDVDVTGAVTTEQLSEEEQNAMMEALLGLFSSIGFIPTGA